MFHCYLDESGIHHAAEVCVIAGYFAGSGQWRKFDKLWRQALRGFELMAASLLKKQHERTKKILEQQIELSNKLNLFNSQSV